MRLHRMMLPFAALLVALGLVTNSRAKSDEVFDVTKLPKAVQKTVKEQVADGKIVRMRIERAGGKIAYGVECSKGDKKWQVEIAPDGKLLLRAEEVKLTDLSAEAQKTVQLNATNGRIESITRVVEDGQAYYEAAVTFNGQEKTFIVGIEGKLLDTQIPENQVRLPQAPEPDPRNGEPKGGGYEKPE